MIPGDEASDEVRRLAARAATDPRSLTETEIRERAKAVLAGADDGPAGPAPREAGDWEGVTGGDANVSGPSDSPGEAPDAPPREAADDAGGG